MDKYRVAFFSECFGKVPYGGPAVRHYNIVKVLLDHGIHVKVIGSRPNQVHPDYKIDNLFQSDLNVRDFDIYWVEQSFRWPLVLNKKGILPIMGANIVPSSAPQHALPYVDTQGHNRQASMEKNEQGIIKNCKGKFWVSQSDFQEKEYRRLGLPYDIPIYRAYNPVDVNFFTPANKKPDKFVIGWTGKHNWAKSPWFITEIVKPFPQIEFRYFSDENTNMTFPSNVVKVIGNTNKKMPELLRGCSMFISTAVTENQPLGIMEAMSCGLPVIAFRTSGIPELIDHGYNGLLVDLGNRQHFIVEIERCLRGYWKLDSIGKEARDTIKVHYSNKACLKQYIDLFKRYLGEK